jgi:Flp pilus assembly protein TadG
LVSAPSTAAVALSAITATIQQRLFDRTIGRKRHHVRCKPGCLAMIGNMQARIHAVANRLFAFATARRLIKQQDGATTVEFALVAAPFLAMVFAIMETAIVFFAGQALETAASDSARLIMTGQAQTSGYDQTKFKQAVCAKIYGLFNCNGGLYVDVKNYTNFSSVNTSKPIDSNGNMVNNFGYSPGGPGDIVVVRLMYQWPVYVSLLGLNLSDMSGGKRLLVSTVAFRNEPYQ